MAIAFVQSNGAHFSVATTTPAVTLAATATADNLLVAGIFSLTANTPTITGWTPLTNTSSATDSVRLFYKHADGTEKTITGTSSSVTQDMVVLEYSNARPTFSTETETSAVITPVGSTYTSASLTPTAGVERLIIGLVGHAVSTAAWTSPLIGGAAANLRNTGISASQYCAPMDLIVTSTAGSYTAAATAPSGTGSGAGAIAIFYPALGRPTPLNNYQFIKVGDGMSVSEKIR